MLISTAASDSEGTLGGLVALGQRRYLERLTGQALRGRAALLVGPAVRRARARYPTAELHAAACHACLFASETSCETGNRWLDRAVLVDLTGDGLAFALVSGAGGSATNPTAVMDWACAIAERLPFGDVRRLAGCRGSRSGRLSGSCAPGRRRSTARRLRPASAPGCPRRLRPTCQGCSQAPPAAVARARHTSQSSRLDRPGIRNGRRRG